MQTMKELQAQMRMLFELIRNGSPYSPDERMRIQRTAKEVGKQLRERYQLTWGTNTATVFEHSGSWLLRIFANDGLGIHLELEIVNMTATLRYRIPENRDEWGDKGWDVFEVMSRRTGPDRVVTELTRRLEGRRMELAAMKIANKKGEIW